MGTELGLEDERPSHQVFVDPFELGVYPVTRLEYAAFLHEAAHERPSDWDDPRFARPDLPVVGVSWFDAVAYGAWLAVLLVSGVAGAQTATAPTETADVAALRVKANAGDAEAQTSLGYAYTTGQGVTQDAVQAVACRRCPQHAGTLRSWNDRVARIQARVARRL